MVVQLVKQLIKQLVKQLMAIPSVMQGLIETEGGKVFELDSPKGAAWIETIGSFRFEPNSGNKGYTVRREPSGYWYGCRKVAGKLRKRYIGKSSNVSIAKLEEIAEALNVPPVPRVNKVAEVVQEVIQVAEVAQGVTQVAEVAHDRLTALELELANLRKALKALQEALPRKSEAGDSAELPKIDNAVVEEFQNKLSNLKTENEKLGADYDALLESSTVVTNKLRQEVQELRSQLEQERADREEVEVQLADRKKELEQLRSELSDLKQKSATASELPEAADLLNLLKAKRKKSKSDLTDLEVILEILEN
jgi:chromosome segregation ATPase